jgi:DNA-binding NtrC family response regulator
MGPLLRFTCRSRLKTPERRYDQNILTLSGIEAEMAQTPQKQTTPQVSLLLVDDEVGFVEVLSKRITRRGMTVTAASSGAEAIQTLRRRDFDVAVLDLKMEDMDGIEVLKIFKKMAPAMPVIMLTGHGSESSAREGIQFGAYDYLTKPYELEDLIQKIKQAIRQGGNRDE